MMCRGFALVCAVLLGGAAWGWSSVEFAADAMGTSTGKTLLDSNNKGLKNTKTVEHPGSHPEDKLDSVHAKHRDGPVIVDLFRSNNLGISDFVESLFRPLFNDEKKKPKVKTVVSLTEFVSPKKSHPNDLFSPFGVKESSFPGNPFMDIPRMLSFMPKCCNIDVDWPEKHFKQGAAINNLSDIDTPWHSSCHHNVKRDKGRPSLEFLTDDMAKDDFLSFQDPIFCDLKDILKKEKGAVMTETPVKIAVNKMSKTLPYIEGAIGGIMLVMVFVVIFATWRLKRPTTIWATLPFVDKSQYVEKV